MWNVLDASDGSLVNVHEKNIVAAGNKVKVGDEVSFDYQGKMYKGLVLFKDRDYAKCNSELNRLSKMKRPAAKPVSQSEQPLPSKRLRSNNPASTSGNGKNSKKKKVEAGPPMTEAEKIRQRIITLNKMEADKRSNQALLSSVKNSKQDDDNEWIPSMDEDSQDSVVNISSHKSTLKLTENEILGELSNPVSPTPSNQSESDSDDFETPPKDDRENLLKQIEELKKQLSAEKERSRTTTTFHQQSSDRQKEIKDGNKQLICNKESDKIGTIGNKLNFGKGEEVKEVNEKKNSDEKKSEKMDRNKDGDDDWDVDFDLLGMDASGKINIDKIRDEMLEYQLYKDQQDTVHIGRGFYVKREKLTDALANAKETRIIIRRLMQGFFIPSKILNCTVTGQVWRVMSKEKPPEAQPHPLHQGAVKALVDFANGVAKKHKWKTISYREANTIMSGKLVEIKSLVKRGKLQD